jgi:chromosome segregation ATPase
VRSGSYDSFDLFEKPSSFSRRFVVVAPHPQDRKLLSLVSARHHYHFTVGKRDEIYSMSDSNTQQQENTDPLENGDLVSSLANLRSILMVEDAASSGGQSSKSLRGWSKAEERIKVLEKQLNEELSLREKQDSSYQSLSEYNKTLSMELELLTESRASMEEKANMSNRALRTEKAQFARKEEEWKAEMIKVTAEKSKSINECERLKARSQYYQQQNEELNDYSKNLRAEIAKLKLEIEAKEVQYCEKHKEETTLQEKLKMCLEETEKTKNAEVSFIIWCGGT